MSAVHGPLGSPAGQAQIQFWGICIPSAAGTPGQAWDPSHGCPLQSTSHLWQRVAPCSGRQGLVCAMQQPDHGSGSSPSPRSWEAPESCLGAMCVSRPSTGLRVGSPQIQGGSNGHSQALLGPAAPALCHVPQFLGGHVGHFLSVIQSLGCRFGSSSPAKDSAELPWPVGVWSQHPLSLPGLAPAGGTRLGKRTGAVAAGRAALGWSWSLSVSPSPLMLAGQGPQFHFCSVTVWLPRNKQLTKQTP